MNDIQLATLRAIPTGDAVDVLVHLDTLQDAGEEVPEWLERRLWGWLPKGADSFHVRWMIRRDMPEVYGLPDSQKWGEGDFLNHLRDRNTIGMVAEMGEKIMGAMIYELHKSHLEVVYFAGCWPGAVQTMLTKLQSKLSSHRRTRVEFHPDAIMVCEVPLFLTLDGWEVNQHTLRVEWDYFGKG